MRVSFLSIIAVLFVFSYGSYTRVQASPADIFTTNLSLGSSGMQVLALQKLLNQDTDTRVANTGPGSPGNETSYFGQLTKSAVIQFQEKYMSDVLTPAGLTHGTGYVGSYTRAKLNSLSKLTTTVSSTASTSTQQASQTDYLVKDSEKIDIYAGDKMIANVQNRILTAINSAIASQSTATATMPTITLSDVPSVVIKELSPRSATVGAKVSVIGTGISSNSAIYFGNDYIVRTLSQDFFGNFSFTVPSIPLALYDLAIQTSGIVSNTAAFVITDPKNPPVHIQSIYPAVIAYGGTLTITGSGFTPQNNIVVTTYQKFPNVLSADGKTLTIQLFPDNLRELAKVGRGTDKIPTSVYVVNEYGFSDSEKLFNIKL